MTCRRAINTRCEGSQKRFISSFKNFLSRGVSPAIFFRENVSRSLYHGHYTTNVIVLHDYIIHATHTHACITVHFPILSLRYLFFFFFSFFAVFFFLLGFLSLLL
ncbi:hypothetical protein PUN28_012274 [Cardiocondyla obscurior]|uniref:Uncharacterized protein n=1 Tax=Cardiocondyla obscurior TaxID=286306 RepID=A0AAW2FBM4_9HYME